MQSGSIRALTSGAAAILQQAGVPSPQVDAELLLAHVLGVPRSELAFQGMPCEQQVVEFDHLVSRRSGREPLQHLTGEAYFRHLTLHVGPGVFIPRPETETLVDLVLADIADRRRSEPSQSPIVVDLCTGSAAVPLAIATEAGGVDVTAVELSAPALAWATRNVGGYAEEVGVALSSVRVVEGDACHASELLPGLVGRTDIVTCNPPYIPDAAIPRDPEVREFDPALALYGGPDGLVVIRDVVTEAAKLLRAGGLLLIEHGDEQGESGANAGVPSVIREAGGFTEVTDHTDLAGRPRVTSARRC